MEWGHSFRGIISTVDDLLFEDYRLSVATKMVPKNAAAAEGIIQSLSASELMNIFVSRPIKVLELELRLAVGLEHASLCSHAAAHRKGRAEEYLPEQRVSATLTCSLLKRLVTTTLTYLSQKERVHDEDYNAISGLFLGVGVTSRAPSANELAGIIGGVSPDLTGEVSGTDHGEAFSEFSLPSAPAASNISVESNRHYRSRSLDSIPSIPGGFSMPSQPSIADVPSMISDASSMLLQQQSAPADLRADIAELQTLVFEAGEGSGIMRRITSAVLHTLTSPLLTCEVQPAVLQKLHQRSPQQHKQRGFRRFFHRRSKEEELDQEQSSMDSLENARDGDSPADDIVSLRSLRPWSSHPIMTEVALSSSDAQAVAAGNGFTESMAVLQLRMAGMMVLLACLAIDLRHIHGDNPRDFASGSVRKQLSALGCALPVAQTHQALCSDHARYLLTSLFGLLSSFQPHMSEPLGKLPQLLTVVDRLIGSMVQFFLMVFVHPVPPQPILSHLDTLLMRPERAEAVTSAILRFLVASVTAQASGHPQVYYHPHSRPEVVLLVRFLLSRVIFRARTAVSPPYDPAQPQAKASAAEILQAAPLAQYFAKDAGKLICALLDVVGETEYAQAQIRGQSCPPTDLTMRAALASGLRVTAIHIIRLMSSFTRFVQQITARPVSPCSIMPRGVIVQPLPLRMPLLSTPKQALPPVIVSSLSSEVLADTVQQSSISYADIFFMYSAPRAARLALSGDSGAIELAHAMFALSGRIPSLSYHAADHFVAAALRCAHALALTYELREARIQPQDIRDGDSPLPDNVVGVVAQTARTLASALDVLLRLQLRDNVGVALALLRRCGDLEWLFNVSATASKGAEDDQLARACVLPFRSSVLVCRSLYTHAAALATGGADFNDAMQDLHNSLRDATAMPPVANYPPPVAEFSSSASQRWMRMWTQTLILSRWREDGYSSDQITFMSDRRLVSVLRRQYLEIVRDVRDNPGRPQVDAAPEVDPQGSIDLTRWRAVIFGAEGTMYEGGIFQLSIEFPNDYPSTVPKMKFITVCQLSLLQPLFHPNIYTNGSICIDILQKKWQSTFSVFYVLVCIRSMLGDPNPSSPANNEAARLFVYDRVEYNRKVRECVENSWAILQGSNLIGHLPENSDWVYDETLAVEDDAAERTG